MKQVNMVLMALVMLSVTCIAGCASDTATVDHRAAVMCGVANQLDAHGLPTAPQDQLDCIWAMENERRAAVNLSDAYHWRKPTYPYPAKQPTTMPWTPEDDVPTAK